MTERDAPPLPSGRGLGVREENAQDRAHDRSAYRTRWVRNGLAPHPVLSRTGEGTCASTCRRPCNLCSPSLCGGGRRAGRAARCLQRAGLVRAACAVPWAVVASAGSLSGIVAAASASAVRNRPVAAAPARGAAGGGRRGSGAYVGRSSTWWPRRRGGPRARLTRQRGPGRGGSRRLSAGRRGGAQRPEGAARDVEGQEQGRALQPETGQAGHEGRERRRRQEARRHEQAERDRVPVRPARERADPEAECPRPGESGPESIKQQHHGRAVSKRMRRPRAAGRATDRRGLTAAARR